MSSYTLTKSERIHISFFGCTNSGKSSVVNAITNQNLVVVSEIKGTTTDPVEKAMELLPLGPVVITDTAGIDDYTELGALRVEKTLKVLDRTDIAILIIDSSAEYKAENENLISEFKKRNIPYIIAFNKQDLVNKETSEHSSYTENGTITVLVSALSGLGIEELKEKIGQLVETNKHEKYIVKGLLKSGDTVILVIPIDESAPKGRIILPQQNVLREVLDADSVAICCQVNELERVLSLVTPQLVITDSQVFNTVKEIVPQNIKLTSFSILMANYKGKLNDLIDGAKKLSNLKDGDKVLISEGCTHHRQCNDIGTVKFPMWIKNFTEKNIEFEFTQGMEFPEDLEKYALIIHCGGCMLNEAEIKSRLKKSKLQKVPIVNYGVAIAYMNGILERAIKIFEKN